MIVHDSAAHKPEALAKGHGILRLRLRLVCCIIPHGYLARPSDCVPPTCQCRVALARLHSATMAPRAAIALASPRGLR